MGQVQSCLNVSPEQMQQLLAETGLDRHVLVSLADVFVSTPTGQRPSPVSPAVQPKTAFSKLTTLRRKVSLAPEPADPNKRRLSSGERRGSLQPPPNLHF
jgi:hypothetical protein